MSLQGVLSDFGAADIFQLIAQQRKTGVLEISNGDRVLDVYFRDSHILRARPTESQPDAALAEWTQKGIPIFGRLTLGTPDDAIAEIERFRDNSGGFGCMLLLAHDCANPEATRKSYELIGRYVMPAVNDVNRYRKRSMEWATKNAATFMPALQGGIQKAIEEHERERGERGGAGTQWVASAPGGEDT